MATNTLLIQINETTTLELNIERDIYYFFRELFSLLKTCVWSTQEYQQVCIHISTLIHELSDMQASYAAAEIQVLQPLPSSPLRIFSVLQKGNLVPIILELENVYYTTNLTTVFFLHYFFITVNIFRNNNFNASFLYNLFTPILNNNQIPPLPHNNVIFVHPITEIDISNDEIDEEIDVVCID